MTKPDATQTQSSTQDGLIHDEHPHTHGPDCGHTAVQHNGHTDYLHGGHLHHQKEDGVVEEHTLQVSSTNPAEHNPTGDGHDAAHVHGPDCGHEAVPHGNHVDYVVNGRLHHPHEDHCDDHGPIDVVK